MGSIGVAPRAPHDEYTTSRFMEARDEYKVVPPYMFSGKTADQAGGNFKFHEGEVLIRDARGLEDEFDLDVQGFAWRKHESCFAHGLPFTPENVVGQYYKDCEKLLRDEMSGIDMLQFFDWRCRNSSDKVLARGLETQDTLDRTIQRGASKELHIDHSRIVVESLVRKMNPDIADFLLAGRVRTINIWRPLNGPIEASPLAVVDWRSVDPDKLQYSCQYRPNHTARVIFPEYDQNLKFWYLHGHDNDEALLFKSHDFDSSVAVAAPHVSFTPANLPPDAKPRQSVECRAIIFTFPEGVERPKELENIDLRGPRAEY